MKYSDIYRLYSTSQPKDAIHQALREVSVDDSDEQYEDRSPLHLACQYGDTEGVKILLERDAEPNTKDANGSTPIHILGRTSAGCADEDKLKEIAVVLMEHGANIPRSAKNTTALIECVRNRHFKMAEAIINSGTRVNSTDLNGENVLFGFCAASGDIRRDIRFAKKELDESVQYSYPENKIEEIRSRIARLEDDGEAAYRLARRLVEEDKVDPEDKSNSGKTAWDAAIENKAMKIAAFLSGSDPDVDELSALHGNMDIFQAMYMKDMEALDAILRSGADLQTVCEHKDMYDFEGKSPLACAFSWFDSIQDAPAMILNGGANPNYRFPNEETAFSVWVSKDYFCKDAEVHERYIMYRRLGPADIFQQVETEFFPQVIVVPVPAEREGHMEDSFFHQHIRTFHQVEHELVPVAAEDGFHSRQVGREKPPEAGNIHHFRIDRDIGYPLCIEP